MTPKVSIVIPCYNRDYVVGETIQSVLDQTYTDYELIVVDDGSTDNSAEVIQSFGDRVKYVYQENGGISAGRNGGLKVAKGEYIAFLDSDDLWLPDKLERQVAYMEAHPQVGFSHGFYMRFDDERGPFQIEDASCLRGDVFADLLYNVPIQTSTVMIRREVYDHLGGFDESLSLTEDLEYFIRIAKYYEFGLVPEVLIHYRVHPGNAERDVENILNLMIEVLGRYLGKGHSVGFIYKQRVYANYYNAALVRFMEQSHSSAEARKYFLQGWHYLIFSPKTYTTIARMLFRIIVPDQIKNPLRKLVMKT